MTEVFLWRLLANEPHSQWPLTVCYARGCGGFSWSKRRRGSLQKRTTVTRFFCNVAWHFAALPLKWYFPPLSVDLNCAFCLRYSRILFPNALAVLNWNRENVRLKCFQKIRIKFAKSSEARFCNFYANFLKTLKSHILPVEVQYRQGIRKQSSWVAKTKFAQWKCTLRGGW